MRQLLVLFALVASGCAAPGPARPPGPDAAQSAAIEALMREHRARTVGIGRIENGEFAWARYYGEQAPGVAAGPTTMFNTASVSKAVTAELAIRLLARGTISLDESISAHYVHPDIVDDPRHEQLTPRLLLTHMAGFLNWPYNYDDGRLAFVRDPGEAYGYSGIGISIFARFLENKLGRSFPALVREEVYEPLGIRFASQEQAEWMLANRVEPLDSEGNFGGPFDRPLGYWSAADDLYVSVPDYARFLIGAMNNEGLGEKARELRMTLQSSIVDDAIWGCEINALTECPSPYGHSIGWYLIGLGDRLNVQHGGNDISEAATAYFEVNSKDGMVVFVNAPNPQGMLLYLKIVEMLDPEQRYTEVFNAILRRVM